MKNLEVLSCYGVTGKLIRVRNLMHTHKYKHLSEDSPSTPSTSPASDFRTDDNLINDSEVG